MSWNELFFSYRGRINRAKYWIAIGIYFAVSLGLGGLGMGLARTTGVNLAVSVIAVVIYLSMTYSGFVVGIKRLHDRNKSGWWLLVFYLLPGVLSGMSMADVSGLGDVFSLISGALSIWTLIELGILRGTIGANRYGPDPINV